MFLIELIGISGQFLGPEQKELLADCVAVAASQRHCAQFGLDQVPIIPISPLERMITQTKEALQQGKVAILASGDPLFYGIGRTLLRHFPAEQLNIHPAPSAMQLACARFKIPWEDLTILSLHGRSAEHVAARVLHRGKVMLFTDNSNTPNRIAAALLEHLRSHNAHRRIQNIRVCVAENLGLEDERLTSGTLEQISSTSFSPLNMMLISQTLSSANFSFGLREHELHHSRGLITKDEIRAASLHKLRLPRQGVFWDVGGGSGSISIEAARLHPELDIYTIEKKVEEQENIRANIKAWNAYNIHLIQGEAPNALAGLPAPDRVFIGGSGNQLDAIISQVGSELRPSGRIVVNAILKKTAEQAPKLLHKQGLRVETAVLSVTRTQYPEKTQQQFNPITIISGWT